MAESVGKRIAQARREKAVRERRDISQRDVAKAVHVSGTSVSDWEKDKTKPRDATLVKLAKLFGVTPAWLRYGVAEQAQVVAPNTAPSADPAMKRRPKAS